MANRGSRLRVLLGVAALLVAGLIVQLLFFGDDPFEGLSPDEARIERLRLDGDVDGLAAELAGDSAAVAALAVRALGRLAPDALPHVERAIKDPRPEVREAAAVALARAGAVDGAPLLAAAAGSDDSATVRAAAVTALGRLHAVDEMPSLLKALSDDSAAVRGRAAEAVAAITGIEFGFRADATPAQRQKAEDQIRFLWKQFETTIRERIARERSRP